MDELRIMAARADHYSSMSRDIAAIASRLAALQQSFAGVAPRTASDDAWVDLLIASATQMMTAAAGLKQIVYVEPAGA